MPRSKSAQKARRASARKRKYNAAHKAAILKVERALKRALAAGNLSQAREYLPLLYKTYDKAAKRGVVSLARAAHKKHQAALLVNRMK